MFQQLPNIQERFSYPSLGISNPNRENPPVTELRDTFAHEWFMEATDWNQAV